MPRYKLDVVVGSSDHGGLAFRGPAVTALEIANLIRPVLETTHAAPNYLADFVFALEVACQEVGLLDEDFNPINISNLGE